MSQRIQKVRSLLKREVSDVLQKDYAFEGVLVSVNDVDVTPDLRQGHVFIGVVGDPKMGPRVVSKLNKEHGRIQQKVNKRIVMKFTPKLHFKLDDSVERGVRVLSLIQEIPEIQDEPADEPNESE